MKKISKKHPDCCPICGQYMTVVCSGYRYKPFIDGGCYEYICQVCYEVPCICRFEDNAWMWFYYDYYKDKELHTLEEMMEGGFTKKEAAISIKAVKKAIKSTK
jgi:hypothetical protein